MYLLHRIAATLFFLAIAGVAHAIEVPDGAWGESAIEGTDPRVQTRVLFDRASVAPGGDFRVGVLFDLDEHWHIYWRNPGEAAYSTEITATSDHATFGEMPWPRPARFTSGGGFITTYGYEHQVLFELPAVAATNAQDRIRVDVVADYLACRVDCIPGRVELFRDLSVQAEEDAPTTDALAPQVLLLFDTWRARHPVAPSAIGLAAEAVRSVDRVRPGDAFVLAWGLTGCAATDEESCVPLTTSEVDGHAAWTPELTPTLEFGTVEVEVHPTDPAGVVVRVDVRATLDAPDASLQTARGVLQLLDANGRHVALELEAPVPRAAPATPIERIEHPLLGGEAGLALSDAEGANNEAPVAGHAATAPRPSLLWVLVLAFFGGVLLNAMPCVLPVLAIKAVGFASIAHATRGHIAVHAVAYTAGIVGSLLVLAGAVIALRATGTAVGWGFQFQHPLYIALVTALVVGFALHLFGVFEVTLDATRMDEAMRNTTGVRRSALEGVLTVVLATPCSAPFLGTAVGFALAASAPVVLAVFIALGLGLASPFVLVTLIPGASRWIPRPGAWMGTLKTALGYCLLLAAVWLLWILASAWGADATARVLVFLLVLAAALQMWGAAQFGPRARARGVLAAATAVVVFAGALLLPGAATTAAPPASPTAAGERDALGWEAWSPEAVARHVADGRSVFVDFTADWCITCKVNERQVIETDEMRAWLESRDVVLLKGDWTRRDDTIRDELARWGKGGVPLYLVYGPTQPAGRALPELLTRTLLQQAIDGAAVAR
jgi:thiol:disulfide interchange protein